jgi:RyR domain
MSPKPAPRKPRSKGKQSGPNIFERIAKTAYEATRAWTETSPGTPRPPWDKAEPWRRESAIEGVKNAAAGRTSEQLHEEWRKDRAERGWRYGEERNPKKKEDPHLRLYHELSDSQRGKSDLFAAIARAQYRCGTERWDVKTLTDTGAGKVNIDEPRPGTVAQLIALPAPKPPPVERLPEECVTYKLKGTITTAKHENDKDIHMVVSDGEGNTLVIEAVSPDCAKESRALQEITEVRQKVEEALPGVAAGNHESGLNLPVTVTGVAFFDFPHGATGAAPNCIELHPVLSFAAD